MKCFSVYMIQFHLIAGEVSFFSLPPRQSFSSNVFRFSTWSCKLQRSMSTLSTKVVWVREKRGFKSYLSVWGSDRLVCLKILPSRKNEIYLWKMGTKLGMYSAIHESVTVARGQRKENTDRVKNQSDCRIRYRALLKKNTYISIDVYK